MKSQTVIILWVTAVVLGVIACIVQFGDGDDLATQTKLIPGDKIFPGLPVMEISRVTLSQGEDSTHLKKLSENTWGVEERSDYPINYDKLRNLLGALREVEVAQGYSTTSDHFPRFGLAESSEEQAERGLRVTMEKSDGSIIADFFLGKYTGTSSAAGRFMRTLADDSGVYSVGETFPGITASPKDWLGTNFLAIEKTKSIAVSAPEDKDFKGWKLIRHPNTDGTVNENGQLKLSELADGEVMQLTSTNQLRNLFSQTSFQDIISEEDAQKTANPDARLKRKAVITTFDGLSYTVTFWPQKEKPKDPNADPRLPPVQPSYLLTVDVSSSLQKTDDNVAQQKAVAAKLDAVRPFKGRIFQVSQSTVAPLQKQRADFVKSTDPSSATTPPAGLPGLPQPAPTQP